MKNLLVKFLILVSFSITGFNAIIYTSTKVSQTFFKPRTISESPVFPLALSNFHTYHNNYKKPYKNPEHWSMLNLQSTYFYQESFKGFDLAKYFLFGEKTTLHVKEDGGGDIYSGWLNLQAPHFASNFDSKFTISPKRKVYGSVAKYHRDLSKHINGLWFSVTLPIVKIEQDLRIKEFDKNHLGGGEATDPTSTPTTIIDALNQPYWKYGKFNTKKTTESGVDDGLLKIGLNVWSNDRSHIDLFGSLLAPTGNRPKAEYVFEALIGNGRHLGVGVGTDFDYALLTGRKRYLHFLGNIRGEYLFAGTERRSFDLKNNGPWSRYLLVSYEGAPNVQLDGINFFTKDMKVTPKWNANAVLALHGEFSNFNVELGYNFWWKDREKVTLRKRWDENIERIGIHDPILAATTASTAKISDNFSAFAAGGDATFVKITQNDLDLNSATHKSAMSHTIYGGMSLNSKFIDYPAMIGIGASFEFPDSNTALQQWSAWLKTGMSF